MSTTNVQLDLSEQQQETEVEQYYGRTKAEQQEQLSRRRGGTGASRSLAENSTQGRRCARCGGAFGRFYNTGASCPRCRHRVCRQCREFRGSNGANNKGEQQGADWLCAVCHKIAELRSATGDWIYETTTLTNPRFVVAKKNSPVDIIKRSIRRAWTISGPPARWSISRKSPAFRIYRSLPIREKIYDRNVDENDIDESNFPELPQANERSTIHNDDNSRVIHRQSVENIVVTERSKVNHVEDNFCDERGINTSEEKIVKNFKSDTSQRSTKNEINIEKKHKISQLDDTTLLDSNKRRKNERETTNERRKIELTDVSSAQENSQPRISLIKPPRIITRIGNNENKQTPKHGDRKSNIPIFRRNSREFEDIGSPQETAKRSLIPQRYRGSTDDLRRSREDISIPSHIPKLFSPRNKDSEKLKRQDSRDDVRQTSKGNHRRESTRQEENRSTYCSTSYSREDQKSGVRIFRRDSREDVGRETTSLPSLCVARAQKTPCKDEKQDRNEVERVGDTITRSKSCPSEQGKTRTFAKENSNVLETKHSERSFSKTENFVIDESPRNDQAIVEPPKMANEKTMMEEPLDISEAKPITHCEDNVDNIEQNMKISDEEMEKKIENLNIVESLIMETPGTNEFIEPIFKNKEIIIDTTTCREIDFAGVIIGEKKSNNDSLYPKRVDDMQVVRRKFSKEEFSNPDDTDETLNRRSSSHLSPEASPLSTRSSRYSPRESESEPTPALPRKIGNGDSCSASQRIRDAITRTRRESNSSARYESSGSESVRLSESGLNSYADLARRVKLFGSGGNGPGPSLGNDEPIQRDSATSAGEDEPHEDYHSRCPGSSQGRTMLRRRRQFDAQGSRRRGRSHARTYCGEELQNLQALHVLGRGGGRQSSPTQCQETQNPDYRRLVFISSDSSSGREEDDADSSCSGSSYLNGLPRNNHTQSLEDCDWDYFESGTLPLPGGITDSSLNVDNALSRDWSCCPGRGSAACLACGGSPGGNVLPVPVPIPVPVPYPVPVPASLWTGDFAAAASSMITRGATPEGTLRLRGDPSAPWFSWHPRFNQPLNGARIDSKNSIGGFDPRAFGFKPEEIAPKIYSPAVEETLTLSPDPVVPPAENLVENSVEQRANDCQNVEQSSTGSNISEEPTNPEKLKEISTVNLPITAEKIVPEVIEAGTNLPEEIDETSAKGTNSPSGQSIDDTEDSSAESSSSRENNNEGDDDDEEEEEESMYRHSRENSASSSGRSSADSSDLEDSASHRFSRVFVVNDDSLTSDNEIEDNEDSDSPRETLVKLKRVTSLAEVEPVVLQRVRLLNEDMTLPRESGDLDNSSERNVERRPNKIERKIDLFAEHDQDANEIYLASSTDFSENKIQLKSIKNLNPDDEKLSTINDVEDPDVSTEENISNQFVEENNWDSVITPDSLEIVETLGRDNPIKRDNESLKRDTSSNCCVETEVRTCSSEVEISSKELTVDNNDDSPVISNDKITLSVENASLEESESEKIDQTVVENGKIGKNIESQNSSSTTDSSEINTTASEISSDELHEYEIFSNKNDLQISVFRRSQSQGKSLTDDEKSIAGHNLNPTTALPRKMLRLESESSSSSSSNSEIIIEQSPLHVSTPKNESSSPVVPPRPQKVSAESLKTQENCRTDEKLIFLDRGKGGACELDTHAPTRNVGDIISSKIQEIFKNSGSRKEEDETMVECMVDRSRDESIAVRGEKLEVSQVGGVSEVVGSECGGGNNEWSSDERGKATTRFRSVERRTPTRKENGGCFSPTSTTTKEQQQQQARAAAASNFPSSNNSNNNSNNKYRSLVMITQGAYQPVSVITSDTTTLLQPNENETQSSQGLAGYFHLALESVNDTNPRNGQPPRRPLMVKRSVKTEREIETKTSVESNSENEDVLKNFSKISPNDTCEQSNSSKIIVDRNNSLSQNDQQTSPRSKVPNSSNQTTEECSTSSGLVILEEGLADDDSWVEEVSHDEDEQSVTTATEESSEDEANNLGDREEELRGYHRQAIDFTLHTIVEESCEESEAEPSLAANSPRKKRPPSASELEKYFFFGLGGENNVTATSSREIDSLSETSSIYSEGLESLGQDETTTTSNQDNANNKGSNEFLNSSRLEKYFLSEFLGFDQDRRDSDGSVGSDSEGRPSPEAQRRKRLVRARGTGRSSHSSSLDNLLALAQGSQNLSLQNSLQDLSLAQDSQETQSEGSSTETDGAEESGQTPAFGTDGQFDTVKRKKKKPRNLGTQSPRVTDDRNKTPEPRETIVVDVPPENKNETINSDDERAKTPQPESSLHSSSSSSSQNDGARGSQASSSDTSLSRGKQASRDSGFVGSCDDLLQHQKSSNNDGQSSHDMNSEKDSHSRPERTHRGGSHENDKRRGKSELHHGPSNLQPPPNASLSRKDSFNNWSSDEETNLMMSKMRQFFKTMVASTNSPVAASNSSGPSPAPSPRLPGYSRVKMCSQNRTKPPQLVYFENELTRLMKTVPGIRDEQVREIVEYLSSEDTWSDSYDSSDYTSSDLEGAAGGRRSALQEQISQSCQQIINKFDTNSGDQSTTITATTQTTTRISSAAERTREEIPSVTTAQQQQPCLGRDTAFVYQKLVQSFTKIAADGPSSDTNSTPHSSPPLIAKVMHHIGSRLVALMHEVSEGGPTVQPHATWRRYAQHHHRTPSSASTTEDDDSTSDSTNPPSSTHLPRSKSHDPLLLINGHPATSGGQEGEEREASDYERFSWRGSFESALMAADSRTKLSLLACSGDVSASASASALAMAAKRRSAGDLLFNPKSFSREQLDRVRSCGSIGGGTGGVSGSGGSGGSIEEKIWSNRRRSSVPDANTRGESGASAGDDDTEDELEYGSDPRATTLPRGMQAAAATSAATNSLPRLPASTNSSGGVITTVNPTTPMHKAHSVYHFLPQHTGVKSARYRPPGFARNSLGNAGANSGPKRAVSAPGLQVSGSQTTSGKRENSRTRRQQQAISLTPDDGSSLSEACSTPIIGAGSRAISSNAVMDIDDMDRGLHSGHLATRASLSSLGARSDSMASVYSGAGEGRWCGSVAVRGEVEFSLQYDYKQLTFEVHVTQCKDLAPVDIKRNRSDPYVKVYLLPDKSKSGKRKTKVKKHTLNPVFDETLKFHMSLNGLETRILWLTVWHSDMFGRNDFLGEVRMPLENKIFDDPAPRWYPLQERTEPFDDPVSYKGEVIVGLKFVPPDPAQLEREREISAEHRGLSKGRKNWSRGSLHVLVKEARNLQTRAKNSGTCDPFCKSYLLPDKGRSGKQKTGVVRRSGGSPVWGHTFVYKDVSLQELAERGLELTVWDHDRIASNEFLGGVRFNLGSGKHYGKVVDWMDATGRELSLWQSMLERPNFWVEGAVTLRPNLHNHVKGNGT